MVRYIDKSTWNSYHAFHTVLCLIIAMLLPISSVQSSIQLSDILNLLNWQQRAEDTAED
jgi:hypothetical protein